MFAIRGFPRLVAGMLLGRSAGQMLALTLVLFVLERHGSAELAGIVTFFSIAPGLVTSPIAGALLDRHGRVRLMIVDYAVAGASLALVAALAAVDLLPVWLLVLIVTLESLTGILSQIGVRTLFPLMVPRPLWERANAIDSIGYVVSAVAGPPLAGALVASVGPTNALLATAAVYVAAAIVTLGVRDPAPRSGHETPLLANAWAGLRYVLRHGTLRGLAVVISAGNVAQGIFYLAFPVLVLRELREGPEVVGRLFGIASALAFVAVLAFGRVRTHGRERALLAASMAGWSATVAVAALAPNVVVLALAMAAEGVAVGPFDVVLFTLRQRRTDPSWLGRAFAVSMALNYSGMPIGSVVGGAIAEVSARLALGAATAFMLLAAALTFALVPATHESEDAAAQAAN